MIKKNSSEWGHCRFRVKPGLYSMRAYTRAYADSRRSCLHFCRRLRPAHTRAYADVYRRIRSPVYTFIHGATCAMQSLGAGNYHQPQLPSANMADSDVGTERYSVFMQILSTYFGVWGLYTTEYHVCTFWTPPFDLRIATFAARWWRKNGGLMVIYNTVWW